MMDAIAFCALEITWNDDTKSEIMFGRVWMTSMFILM